MWFYWDEVGDVILLGSDGEVILLGSDGDVVLWGCDSIGIRWGIDSIGIRWGCDSIGIRWGHDCESDQMMYRSNVSGHASQPSVSPVERQSRPDRGEPAPPGTGPGPSDDSACRRR